MAPRSSCILSFVFKVINRQEKTGDALKRQEHVAAKTIIHKLVMTSSKTETLWPSG